MKTINIILADDHSLFRKGMKKILEDIGDFRVTNEAVNGAILLHILDKPEHHPDVILMDLNMPELNGPEATVLIRKKYPEIKIIALSVYDEEHYILRMIESGADAYLFKNTEPDEVEKAIRDVMANGYYFNKKVLEAIRKVPVLKTKRISFNLVVNLTPREEEILGLICSELTAAEIAEKLFISIRTVDGHRQKLLDKTGARNTAGLVIYAIKNKLHHVGF